MKVKVKILDAIAGLADPKPVAVLDLKYEKMRMTMRSKERPLSEAGIEQVIAASKKYDRCGDPVRGFSRDFSFKPGEEVMLESDIAQKWEACGICDIIPEAPRRAA